MIPAFVPGQRVALAAYAAPAPVTGLNSSSEADVPGFSISLTLKSGRPVILSRGFAVSLTAGSGAFWQGYQATDGVTTYTSAFATGSAQSWTFTPNADGVWTIQIRYYVTGTPTFTVNQDSNFWAASTC